MKIIVPLSILSLLLFSCSQKSKTYTFAQQVEQAHNKKVYQEKKATQFDLLLFFGGKERLNGKLTLTNDSKQGRIQLTSGEEIIFNEDKVYASPEIDKNKVRFDAFTWAYFFQFPFKLSDPGTTWENLVTKSHYDTQKLSFKSGTGDAPDDWYIVYADPKTKLIDHASYIVTAYASVKEAEKDPHAIKYSDYIELDGVKIAQNWGFFNWSLEKDLEEKIGEASLKNIKFISLKEDFFSIPDGYQEVKQ